MALRARNKALYVARPFFGLRLVFVLPRPIDDYVHQVVGAYYGESGLSGAFPDSPTTLAADLVSLRGYAKAYHGVDVDERSAALAGLALLLRAGTPRRGPAAHRGGGGVTEAAQ